MSCCIGGVCIPYTAIVPMVLLGLKWIVTKLAYVGLLPSSVVQWLGLSQREQTNVDCCSETNAPTKVMEITSEEQWNELMAKKEMILVKFTATWCKPCKTIAPKFSELSTLYQAHFCQVDVDDLDNIASKFRIAMMPTFIWLSGDMEMGRMTGSNEGQLETLVAKHLSKRVK